MKKLLLLPVLMISLFSFGQGRKTLPLNYDGGYYYPTGNHGLLPSDTVVLSGNYAYALFEKVNGTAYKWYKVEIYSRNKKTITKTKKINL